MKWLTAGLALLMVALIILAAGCPQQTGTEATKTDTTIKPAEPPAATEGQTKTADAEQLLQDRCTQCHGIDRVEKEQAKADAEEWSKIVKRMQKNAVKMKKTPITDEEAAKILSYLVAASS